jgi:hypothetical protein
VVSPPVDDPDGDDQHDRQQGAERTDDEPESPREQNAHGVGMEGGEFEL